SERDNTLKEIVFHVLPEAIAKASGIEKYPIQVRTLFYQIRSLIQAYTDKELDQNYFGQKLLIEYQQWNGPIEGLYYEPRGFLYEPHTGRAIPLGTQQVESYDFPAWTYDKILYIEKRGLWPILQRARIAERYDLAIVAAEGYATEAARVL